MAGMDRPIQANPLIGGIRALDDLLFGGFKHQYVKLIRNEIVGQCQSVLDVGCGPRSIIEHFAHEIPYTIGLDVSARAIESSRQLGIHDDYKILDVSRLAEHFTEGSFDCVLAVDVVEHLEKGAALRLISDMERVARRKVIIFTPNGFLRQTSYDDNPFQEHLSGWSPEEMRALGYRLTGAHGWKPLRRERGVPRLRPRRLWERISYLTQPFVLRRPEFAFQILCVKEL